MRTKTLILSAIAGALSCASMMGQVYSLNAVGYINVTCPPGFSIIANQLNSGNNTINALLTVPLDGSHDFDVVYKFSNASGYSLHTMDSQSGTAILWDDNAVTNTTLNPGEAIFYRNNNPTPITFTFVGTVLQGSLTNSLLNGFNLVSSMVPQAGKLGTDLGLAIDPAGSQDFDVVYTYANVGGYTLFTADSQSGNAYNYDGASEPSVSVGQGFFYRRNNPGTTLWVRSFTVN